MKAQVFLDESGTPSARAGEPHLFIAAGVGVAGEVEEIDRRWRHLRSERRILSSGTKFSSAQFHTLEEFILQYRLYPIAFSSQLDDDDFRNLEPKLQWLRRERPGNGVRKMRRSTWVWINQVPQAAIGLLAAMLEQEGPIEEVEITIDEYSKTSKVDAGLRASFRMALVTNVERFVQRERDDPLNTLEKRFLAARIGRNARYDSDKIRVNFRNRNSLGGVADGLASLVRRTLEGNRECERIWARLTEHFRERYAIANDWTEELRRSIRKPWPER